MRTLLRVGDENDDVGSFIDERARGSSSAIAVAFLRGDIANGEAETLPVCSRG